MSSLKTLVEEEVVAPTAAEPGTEPTIVAPSFGIGPRIGWRSDETNPMRSSSIGFCERVFLVRLCVRVRVCVCVCGGGGKGVSRLLLLSLNRSVVVVVVVVDLVFLVAVVGIFEGVPLGDGTARRGQHVRPVAQFRTGGVAAEQTLADRVRRADAIVVHHRHQKLHLLQRPQKRDQ